MAAGYVHIIKLGEIADSGGLRVPQYQFTYNDGENTYARTFSEGDLIEFLREDISVRPDLLDRVVRDMRSGGSSMLNDVHISDNEAAAMGLVQAAADV